MLDELDLNGFRMIPHAFSAEFCERLAASVDAESGTCHRGLLAHPSVAQVAASEAVRDALRPYFPLEPRAVRAIYFDKTPDSNWFVAWHQDVTIALSEKEEVGGYGPWTIKDGLPHAHAPAELLENMLTVRLHLDDADESNGALQVIPGSHAHGKLNSEQIVKLTTDGASHLCQANVGDMLLMRPLLLHASHKSTSDKQRRILHIEFAAGDLPSPLEWNDKA
jgi:Phytanoyl-CoA dioxygenase (PhyH)